MLNTVGSNSLTVGFNRHGALDDRVGGVGRHDGDQRVDDLVGLDASSVVVLLVLLFVTPGLQLHPGGGAGGPSDPRRHTSMINRHQIRVAVPYRPGPTRSCTSGPSRPACSSSSTPQSTSGSESPSPCSCSRPAHRRWSISINERGELAELTRSRPSVPSPEISIIHVEGELFFGAADLFQEEVRRLAEDQNIRVFILRMKNARHLDASTVMALENLTAICARRAATS